MGEVGYSSFREYAENEAGLFLSIIHHLTVIIFHFDLRFPVLFGN